MIRRWGSGIAWWGLTLTLWADPPVADWWASALPQVTHASPEVRARTFESLAQIKHPAIIPLIKIGLGDSDLRVFHAAYMAINPIDTRAYQDLNAQTVRELPLEHYEAVEGLYRVALTHPSLMARIEPASGMPPPYALLLTLVLKDPEMPVRYQAMEFLYDQFRDSPVSWRLPMKDWRKDTIFSRSARLLPYVQALMETEDHPAIRGMARETYMRLASKEEQSRWAEAWNDPLPAKRVAALVAMRYLIRPVDKAHAVSLLAERDDEIRYEAVRALAAMGAAEELTGRLNDPLPEAQFRAAECLQASGRYDELVLTFAVQVIHQGRPKLADQARALLRTLFGTSAMSLWMARADDPVLLMGDMAFEYWERSSPLTPDVLPALVKGMGHRDPALREQALGAILKAFSQEALRIFSGRLGDPNALLAEGAVKGLGFLGQAEAEPLLLSLVSQPAAPGVKAEALKELGSFWHGMDKSPARLQIMLTALEDRAPRVRQAAALVLSLWGEVEAAPALGRHLRDSDPQVRVTAVKALTRLMEVATVRQTLMSVLPELAWPDQFEVACIVADRKPPGWEDLVFAIGSRNLPLLRGESGASAVYALLWSGQRRVLPLLVPVLQGDDLLKKLSVVNGLSSFGPEGLGLLRRCLGDPDEQVRSLAFIRLKQAPPDEALQGFLEATKDPILGVRLDGIRGLIELKDPRAVPHLLALGHDGDPLCRRAALMALGRFDATPERIAVFQEALKDPISIVRCEAIKGLGQWNVQKAVPHIQQALSDPDFMVRMAALATLSEMGVAPPAFHLNKFR